MKARVLKPEGWDGPNFRSIEGPGWVLGMNNYIGKIIEVKKDGRIYSGEDYIWLPEWLELIDEDRDEEEEKYHSAGEVLEDRMKEAHQKKVEELNEKVEKSLDPYRTKFGDYLD